MATLRSVENHSKFLLWNVIYNRQPVPLEFANLFSFYIFSPLSESIEVMNASFFS